MYLSKQKTSMSKRKNTPQIVSEPSLQYVSLPKQRQIHIFSSFEEAENFERQTMANSTALERLQHLRLFINTAYGMKGYDPLKIPKKHTIRIIKQ